MSGDSVRDMESLADWLRGEPALTGRVRLSGQGLKPGELGSAADTVTVLLGAGGTGTALIATLRTWLAQPRRSDIKLKITRDGEATVEIDAKRVRSADLEPLLREALGSGQGSDIQE
ncbi:effector-associated constant component EACC1 [Streptomyces triticisoli]|uniref:effector-associated constant component EACC1 n=1 Tax=Streptomyces triticisoli TaxID=2182797 RepID=UPI0022B7FE2A|nr:hypothetical protein [Streptomyces triticisoli]